VSAAARQRIVVIDRVPRAARGAGYPRAVALLEELTALPDADVTLLAAGFVDDEDSVAALRAAGIEVVTEVAPETWLGEHRFECDLVIVSRPDTGHRFADAVHHTQPQARLVYDCEALSYRRMQGASRLGVDAGGDPEQTRGWELDLVARADLVLCVTEVEREVVAAVRGGRRARLVTYGMPPVGDAPGWAERSGVLFFGGFAAGASSPNLDAVHWLVEAVMPLVWRTHPDLRLRIVGAEPPASVQALGSERIEVIGEVADPAPYLASSRVLLAPQRFGAGLKLRFVDAMAAGLPFVTTPVGAEGIELGAAARWLVGTSPDELATAVRRLVDDAALWEHCVHRLRREHARAFTRARFRDDVVTAMAALGVAPPRPALV
jgi:glycosyltransferase involved in cell wall biosynthesis